MPPAQENVVSEAVSLAAMNSREGSRHTSVPGIDTRALTQLDAVAGWYFVSCRCGGEYLVSKEARGAPPGPAVLLASISASGLALVPARCVCSTQMADEAAEPESTVEFLVNCKCVIHLTPAAAAFCGGVERAAGHRIAEVRCFFAQHLFALPRRVGTAKGLKYVSEGMSRNNGSAVLWERRRRDTNKAATCGLLAAAASWRSAAGICNELCMMPRENGGDNVRRNGCCAAALHHYRRRPIA